MAYTAVVVVSLCLSLTGGYSPQTVFIQTKQDLLMTVTEEVDLGDDIFHWKFNNKNILRLLANKITNYTDKVEFFSHNLSLVLKNVQLNDSGIYTAVVTRQTDETYAEYNVIVQAPVSPVTVTVGSVSNSSESCNFTVSCTTENFTLSHSFTCNTHSCEDPTEGYTKPTPSGSSLHLYLSNSVLICNHSNQVSWRNDTADLKQHCPLVANNSSVMNNEKPRIAVVVVVVAVLVVIALSAAALLYQRPKNKTVNTENHDVSQVSPAAPPAQGKGDAVVESPNATYSLVGPHTGPAPANPEPLYAQVTRSSNF